MSDAQHILNCIAAIARGFGRSPSQSEFFALARISEHYVTKFFPRWNDAVRAAGLHPHTLNVRLDDSELLKDWGETVRRNRGIPSRRAYRHQGKYDIRTIERRFGVPWSLLPQVFRSFAHDKPEWADVVELLGDWQSTNRYAAAFFRFSWCGRFTKVPSHHKRCSLHSA